MEFVPSLSRSSVTLLDGGSDKLKSHRFQEDFRKFIQEGLDRYWEQFPLDGHLSAAVTAEQSYSQSNILLLLRKLREGLLASKRVDDFALEVYETSLHLSILYRASDQTTSILAQLLPQRTGTGFYDAFSKTVSVARDTRSSLVKLPIQVLGDLRNSEPRTLRTATSQVYLPPARHNERLHGSGQGEELAASRSHVPNAQLSFSGPRSSAMVPTYLSTWLLSLLHALLQPYPSRSAYYKQLQTYQDYPGNRNARRWLQSILASLECRNYVRLQKVTRSSELDTICRSLSNAGDKVSEQSKNLGHAAIRCIVGDLRAKARETAWAVLRAGYREIDVSRSADWLSRFLLIGPNVESIGAAGSSVTDLQNWLNERPRSEVSRKEGTSSEGWWTLYRHK